MLPWTVGSWRIVGSGACGFVFGISRLMKGASICHGTIGIGRDSKALARLVQTGQSRAGDCDKLTVKLDTVGPTACELNLSGPLLGRAAMVSPCQTADQGVRPLQQAHHDAHSIPQQLLPLGSWIGAAVTVLSNRTTLPSSRLQLAADLVRGAKIECAGLGGAFSAHCRLRRWQNLESAA